MSSAGGPAEVARVNVGVSADTTQLSAGLADAKAKTEQAAASMGKAGAGTNAWLGGMAAAIKAPLAGLRALESAVLHSVGTVLRLGTVVGVLGGALYGVARATQAAWQWLVNFGETAEVVGFKLADPLLKGLADLQTFAPSSLINVEQLAEDVKAIDGLEKAAVKARKAADDARRANEAQLNPNLRNDMRVAQLEEAARAAEAIAAATRDRITRAEQEALAARQRAEAEAVQKGIEDIERAQMAANEYAAAKREREVEAAREANEEIDRIREQLQADDLRRSEEFWSRWRQQADDARALSQAIRQAQIAGMEAIAAAQRRHEERMVVSLGRLVELAEMSARNQRR